MRDPVLRITEIFLALYKLGILREELPERHRVQTGRQTGGGSQFNSFKYYIRYRCQVLTPKVAREIVCGEGDL